MRRRISLKHSVAWAALFAAAPLAAQATSPATPPATPTPTPTPAPVGDEVGPPQLRDFTINGTVTQPAQPATPTPAPVPTERATPPRTTTAPGSAAPARAAPTVRAPSLPAPDIDPAPQGVTVDLPPPTAAPLAPTPLDTGAAPVVTDPVAAPDASATPWWPWLAALLAVALGAGLLWWRRQQQSADRYAADHGAVGELVSVPDAPPVPLPRAKAPPPRPAAQPAPRAPQPTPRPAPRAPLPAAAAVPAPPPPAAPAPPPSDGIVTSRFKPDLAFELVPLRAEADGADGAALTFDLIIINQGSAPARDVLVEARLINAGPTVDGDVGRFFLQPAGTGERLPLIAPMGRVSLRSRLAVAGADLAPLIVEGRKLFVPVVAVNADYRWSAGDLKASSSFLVGRGDSGDGKMAPFRLDRGARSWSDLGARLHSTGLQR